MTTRREVLAAGAALAASSCFPEVGGEWATVKGVCLDGEVLPPITTRSPVAEVRREDAVQVDSGTGRTSVNEAKVREMLEALLTALVPQGNAWRVVLPDFTAETRIGIKVNVLNERCATSLPLVKALVDSLVAGLGASRDRIIVWDRRVDELERSGYTRDAVGAQVMGTTRSVDDASGPGYAEPSCGVVAGSVPRLSRILTDLTDVTINVPVLKTHAICGLTGAMKNIYGVIDNPGDYHKNVVTALPALYRLPLIRQRFRFHVLDALIAVTTGGTSDPADTVPKRLLASSDPLALDAAALALADQLRDEKGLGLGPVERSATGWLENAHALGLGSLHFDKK